MKDANGNNLNSPHVDPPSGGYQGTPDDNKPPYWTANERKAAILNNANCFTFSDGPQTSGNLRHFELFLVDIYGNQIQIKAGLNWGIYRNASGGAEKFPVTPHVYNGNNYPNDLDNVVNHDFPGWHVAKLTTLTPMVLPVATLLLVLALMGLAIWVLSRTKTDAA
jgi:hypothetical protein